MVYFKELIGFLSLVAVVAANHYSAYQTPYSPQYRQPSYQAYPKVNLQKLCSWNVIEYDYPLLKDDSWDSCKLDAGRNYIPENNIPSSIAFSDDRRVFLTLASRRTGVYATLAYFRLDDIKDGRCPPLKAYPSDEDNSLDAQCCTKRNLVNIDRMNIDACNRLWVVDRQGLNLNDKNWILGSPRLVIYNLKDDTIDREIPIPSEYYFRYQLGLDNVILNIDSKDCGGGYGYIIDTYNGAIIVYSYKDNKFWRVSSSEFFSDAKYSKFTIKTLKNKDVTYYRQELIYDCSRDLKNQRLICHSVASLDEFAIPFDELNSEETAKCAPDSLNVKFLGQKCKNCQTNTHTINREKQIVWGAQELNYGVGCWNLENPLNPDAVQVVVSDPQRLPYVTDLTTTKHDLTRFSYGNVYAEDDTYVVVLSNNRIGIEEHGFDSYEENFGIYFFSEKEAIYAYPQCLPQEYVKPAYQPAPYQPAPYQPASYQPAPYQQAPVYRPVSYQPAPYQPASYQPASYQPAPYKPAPTYQQPAVYNAPRTQYRYKKSEESAAAAESKKE